MILYILYLVGHLIASKLPYSIIDIQDLIDQGKYTPQLGLLIVKNFLIEEEENLDKWGVVYDETGFDGMLGSRFQPSPIGTEQRLDERVKSAAYKYIAKNYKNSDMELMGILPADEKVKGWWIRNAIFYENCGNQGLHKICVLEQESEGYFSFVLHEKASCSDKVYHYYLFEKKAYNFYKKKHYDNLYQEYYDKHPELQEIQNKQIQDAQNQTVIKNESKVEIQQNNTINITNQQDKEINKIDQKQSNSQKQKDDKQEYLRMKQQNIEQDNQNKQKYDIQGDLQNIQNQIQKLNEQNSKNNENQQKIINLLQNQIQELKNNYDSKNQQQKNDNNKQSDSEVQQLLNKIIIN